MSWLVFFSPTIFTIIAHNHKPTPDHKNGEERPEGEDPKHPPEGHGHAIVFGEPCLVAGPDAVDRKQEPPYKEKPKHILCTGPA
jgi:hypothetical protein